MYNHIIKKYILEFHFQQADSEEFWNKSIRTICYDGIIPGMNRVFDNLNTGDRTIKINRMTLDLGKISYSEFKNKMGLTILSRIEEKLAEYFKGMTSNTITSLKGNLTGKSITSAISYPANNSINLISRSSDKLQTDSICNNTDTGFSVQRIEDKVEDVFLFFLSSGYLPWWCSKIEWHKLENLIIKNFAEKKSESVDNLFLLLRGKPYLVKRLTTQFSFLFSGKLIPYLKLKAKSRNRILIQTLEKNFETIFMNSRASHLEKNELSIFKKSIPESELLSVVKLITTDRQLFEYKIEILIADTGYRIYTVLEKYILRMSQILKTSPAVIYSIIEKRLTLSEKKILRVKSNPKIKVTATDNIIKDYESTNVSEIYIENSGLVLLHPFLVIAFSNLGWLINKDFKGFREKAKSVHFMQYLVTGKAEDYEKELVLNKYLAGISVAEPLGLVESLNCQEKSEAEDLLLSVIKNWKALKNTSIKGLQESFLKRPGKLVIDKDIIKLEVESRSQDILLTQLPWTISVVKFPWNKIPLYIKWI